jgi:hypothetical protein
MLSINYIDIAPLPPPPPPQYKSSDNPTLGLIGNLLKEKIFFSSLDTEAYVESFSADLAV